MIAILLARSLSIAVLAKGLIDFHLLASSRVRPQPLHQPVFPENWQISIHGLFLRFMITCFLLDQLKSFILLFLSSANRRALLRELSLGCWLIEHS